MPIKTREREAQQKRAEARHEVEKFCQEDPVYRRIVESIRETLYGRDQRGGAEPYQFGDLQRANYQNVA